MDPVIKEIAKSIAERAKEGPRSLLEAKSPPRAAQVIELLAKGYASKTVANKVGCGIDAVIRMKLDHAEVLGKRREIMARDAMELAEKARVLQHEKMDQLLDDPEQVKALNLRDLAMSYGIFADKWHMATEGNKMVIEHKSGAPSIEDAQRVIAEARAKLNMKAIEVDVSPASSDKTP